jgi:galactose mutarotase-like enzyme
MPKITRTEGAFESLVLEEEASAATVGLAPARGGMVTRFQVGAVPVLYLDPATLADPAQNVRGGIPILFPIAGKLPEGRYEHAGRTYAMKQHGFARNLAWQVLDESTDDGASVTLGVGASELTRSQYPFEFNLQFTYRLRAGVLSVEQRFENLGAEPMPVQPGLHPYFHVPDVDKQGVRLPTDATRAIDNTSGQEVALHGPLEFAGREVDLFLLDHGPRDVVLERPNLPGIRIAFGAEQAVLVVWTLPGRDFICVEPWRERAGLLAQGTAPVIEPHSALTTTLTLSLV